MKVVIDTNVFISGTFWSGSSAQVLALIEQKRVELVLSLEIIQEFNRVILYPDLQAKIRNKRSSLQAVAKIARMASVVKPKRRLHVVEDPDDNKFLEAALAGNASFLITQDKHLLKLRTFRQIRILTPEAFLPLVKSACSF